MAIRNLFRRTSVRCPPRPWPEFVHTGIVLLVLGLLLAITLRSYYRIDYLQVRWNGGERPYDYELYNGTSVHIEAILLCELRAYFRYGRVWLGYYSKDKHSPGEARPMVAYSNCRADIYDGWVRLRPPDWARPREWGLGLATAGKPDPGNTRKTVYRAIGIPLWIPAVVVILAFLPGFLRRRRFRHRVRGGLCLTCGYDLRASTGNCPECGEPTVVVTSSAA